MLLRSYRLKMEKTSPAICSAIASFVLSFETSSRSLVSSSAASSWPLLRRSSTSSANSSISMEPEPSASYLCFVSVARVGAAARGRGGGAGEGWEGGAGHFFRSSLALVRSYLRSLMCFNAS